MAVSLLRWIATGEKLPAAVTVNNQNTALAKSTFSQPSLEESFTLIGILQHP